MSDAASRLRAARETIAALNLDGPRVATFARGLALGALVGAAIAGTAMLDRRARGRRQAADGEARAKGRD
jgi:hypothetical protein